MNQKQHVFVSSVQKELEDERVVIQNLLNTDPFLSSHCTPVLYEFEPASPDRDLEGCLKALDASQVYLLVAGSQYGRVIGDLSVTHLEYRHAKERGLPILIFIKGDRDVRRDAGTGRLLEEIDADGFKYKRFGNVIDLQKEVRVALVKVLEECFGIAPSSDENEIARQTIEATSPFESQLTRRARWLDLDHDIARQMIAAAEGRDPATISLPDLLAAASLRGLVWRATRRAGSISPRLPALSCWRRIRPGSFPSAASLPMPTAAPNPTAIPATTRISAPRCRWQSTAPFLLSTATPGTR